jgi:glycosyltransferase involved in cell wall biosynthesis
MISVAMITMNEEDAVGKVIKDILTVVSDADIIIVDSSRDRTAEIAEELGARVVKQIPPQGYGMAMDIALRSARGDVVITLDCDDTYPVDKIPELADYVLKDGYDVVDASRLPRKPEAMPMINYLANWGFALIASVLFMKRFTDLHSGMRAYRKSMIDQVQFVKKGDAYPVELLLKPVRLGYKYKSIFIDYKERVGQSKMRPLQSAWYTMVRILRSRFAK